MTLWEGVEDIVGRLSDSFRYSCIFYSFGGYVAVFAAAPAAETPDAAVADTNSAYPMNRLWFHNESNA